MQEQTPSHFDKNYNDQSNLLDGLYAFHPEYFDELSSEEFEILQTYYLFATPADKLPENVFNYRADLIQERPSLQPVAEEIYNKLTKRMGIES